jgi:ankyrin repeat protein
MTADIENVPSGKSITRRFGDDGQLLEESHSYGALEIGCSITYGNGAKIQELYFVKKRMVRRARYEKERLNFPDMPPADPALADTGGEMAKLARKGDRQRVASNKRRRANPLSEEQERQNTEATPLFHFAAGNLDKARELLEGGADPNFAAFVSATERGQIPLYNACFADSEAAVRLLLEYSADPNKRFEYHSRIDGRVERELTALMFAGSVGVARALLEAGAEVNVQDAAGVTPLMRAARRGKPELVALLLESGALAATRSASGHSATDFAVAKIDFYKQNTAILKEGSAGPRIKEFEEVCRLLSESER